MQENTMPLQNPKPDHSDPKTHFPESKKSPSPPEKIIICSSTDPISSESTHKKPRETAAEKEEGAGITSGRERLKRHRVEVAGRVWIPDMWGQEGLLNEWIDCAAFDASLVNSSIMSARDSLAEEGRRATATRLRVHNGF